MVGESSFQGGPGAGRRGLVGLLILSAHAGAIALFALAMRVPLLTPELPAVTVEFLEQPSKLDVPKLPEAKLGPVAAPTVEEPDISLAVETEVRHEMTPDMQASPATTPVTASRSRGSAELPSLSDVAYLDPPAPRYPPESKRAREEGLVILRVVIDESGHASSVNIYRSSGHPRLDEAARNAIQRALFKPYLDGGVARASVAMVPVEFSLRGAGDRGRRSG